MFYSNSDITIINLQNITVIFVYFVSFKVIDKMKLVLFERRSEKQTNSVKLNYFLTTYCNFEDKFHLSLIVVDVEIYIRFHKYYLIKNGRLKTPVYIVNDKSNISLQVTI